MENKKTFDDEQNKVNRKEPILKYLSIAHRFYSILLDNLFKEHKISHGQIFILIRLYHKQGISQKNICEKYSIDKAAVGRGIDKLVKQGFIKKEINPEDKRNSQLFLTSKAEDFKIKFLNLFNKTEKIISKGLTGKEKKEIIKIMKKICRNLGASLC